MVFLVSPIKSKCIPEHNGNNHLPNESDLVVNNTVLMLPYLSEERGILSHRTVQRNRLPNCKPKF